MSLRVQIEGIPQAIAAMSGLVPAVRIRHMRISLNAAMGVIRGHAVTGAPRDSRLLSRSLRVKVVVPQSSKNHAHHDRPAWGMVGAGRGLDMAVVTKASGKRSTTTFAKAQEQNKARVLSGKTGNKIERKRASRYLHLAEKEGGIKGPGGTHFMANAAKRGATAANAKFTAKIQQGIDTEAKRLASKP